MAKRAIVMTVAFALLAVPLCFAQPRDGTVPTPEGQTTFGSIECTGLQQGAPGYICLHEATGDERFYIWVDSSGDLRIASDVQLTPATNASPPLLQWGDEGVAVGDQTD